MTNPAALVEACRYPTGPNFVESSGLWTVTRQRLPDPKVLFQDDLGLSDGEILTALFRTTEATMHLVYGECVMEDSRRELRRHLAILTAAEGRVLVTGLGLGCVLRGLLSKPAVEHVDVMEIDPHVIRLTGWEFRDNPRVKIRQVDALTYDWPPGTMWDYAWHDGWKEEGSLDLLHLQLIARYQDRVRFRQGAWGWNRAIKRTLLRACPEMLA